jgi:hypothetical protein
VEFQRLFALLCDLGVKKIRDFSDLLFKTICGIGYSIFYTALELFRFDWPHWHAFATHSLFCHSEPSEESLLFLAISISEIPRSARNDNFPRHGSI